MNTFKILFAEIWYRKLNFVLSLFAVVVAVTLFVAGPMLVEAYQAETAIEVDRMEDQVGELEAGVADMRAGMKRVEDETAARLEYLKEETRKLMITMGFNLLIVHGETNMSDFWANDFAAKDMPQEYVDRLASNQQLTLITHLVATLQQRIEWEKRKVLLVGYLPETTQSHARKKAPMGYNIEPGTVLLGYELGVDRKVDETITVLDKEFRIAAILGEKGSKQDITIAMHLTDAQELLDKPGRINQILALGCNCVDASLPDIREELGDALPGTRITEHHSIALARAEQRKTVAGEQAAILAQMGENLRQREKIVEERKVVLAEMTESRARIERIMVTLADVITPLVVLVCAIWVGLLALANVRQRSTEIGLLRALGKGSGMIAGLFLGKAVLVGLIGAAAGFLLGTWMAQFLGQSTLDVASGYFDPRIDILAYAMIGAPLLSALASYLPTLFALIQDPAVVLRET